jgi:pimeloyl-ACP methyl ester carboxylesterase
MTLEHLSIHGHRVAFRTAGDGPVVLLVHGMAGSSATWKHVIPALAQRFTVVAPDLLGHGESGKPRRGEYSLGAQANFLRDLLQVLGHERVSLVGQSLGGGIAMQLAYQFPERCERLVLVGSGGLGREVNLLLRLLAAPGAEYAFPLICTPGMRDAGNLVAACLHRLGVRAAPSIEEIWRSYSSLAEADTRKAFFRTLHAVIDLRGQAVTATDRLYLASHVPTLLVWGAQDRIIPVSHAVDAHEAMPGSRLEVFDDVGHFPHCEAPERFVEVLVDFIASTHPAAVSAERWRELIQSAAPTNGARGAVGQFPLAAHAETPSALRFAEGGA